MAENPARRLYIATVSFKGIQKRLFLEGEDGAAGESRYREAAMGLSQIGDSAGEWPEFLARTIRRFEEFGFVRTAH